MDVEALMTNLITFCVFGLLGAFFVLFNLAFGRFVRTQQPSEEKLMPYECGEVPEGDSWVQFDLRFYIIALIFLVFDVEVALFYPWATVYQQYKNVALVDMLAFFGILMVGYVYLWRFGYLEWVRSAVTTTLAAHRTSDQDRARLSQLARHDPEN